MAGSQSGASPVLAARDEPRAVRAEGVRPDAAAVAVADRRLLAGRRVEQQQPNPLAVRPDARQTRAVRAHGNGPRPLRPRHRHATNDLAALTQQVKGRVPDPRRDSQPAAGLRDGDNPPVLDADRQTPCSPPSRSVTRKPAPVTAQARSRSGAPVRRPAPSVGNVITEEPSSSRLLRCRHSHVSRKSSGTASSWRGGGHVVRRQGRDRGSQAGLVGLDLRLALLVQRGPGAPLGPYGEDDGGNGSQQERRENA